MAHAATQHRHVDCQIGAPPNILFTNEVLPYLPPPDRVCGSRNVSDAGALRDEVIVYIGALEMYRWLVSEGRRLFDLPILSNIKAFDSYKAKALYNRPVEVDAY